MERIKVRVEPLHPRHADALEELVLASGDPDRRAVAADLRDFLWIESMTLLAFGAPGLIGYLIGTTDDRPLARVRWLYTRPEVRRQGVALALTGAFARRALLDDCLEIAFDCGPSLGGQPADGFLHSIGLSAPERPVLEIADLLKAIRPRP